MPPLVEALNIMGHDPIEAHQIMVVSNEQHAKGHLDVPVNVTAMDGQIGFKWNSIERCYDLVVDRQTWSQSIPVERFMYKLTQQYARMSIHQTIKLEGFEVTEEWEMEDNSIELMATRWIS